MRRVVLAIVVTCAITAALALLSIYGSGTYGYTLFLGVPFLVGYVPTALMAIVRPRSFAYCLLVSLFCGFLLSFGFLAWGIEGLICVVMSVPLMAPVIGLGTFVAYALFHAYRLPQAESSALMLAAIAAGAIAIEPAVHRGPPTVYLAEDSVEVRGTRREVWETIVSLSDVAPQDDLFFRAGIACPQKTRIVTTAEGGLRVCTLTTGTLLERIDAWEPERRLGWRALSTPPPMRELNPFHEVDAPHLHGYYRNVRGEFVIEPAGDRVRLTRRTWYEHDLYPSAYWRFWCDIGASKIHRLVLDHVRDETERRRGGGTIEDGESRRNAKPDPRRRSGAVS